MFIFIIIFYIIINTLYYYNNNIGNFNNFKRKVAIYILNKIGYMVNEESFKNMPSKMILISSHTSIYDFLLGCLIYYSFFNIEYDIYIFMKKDFEVMTSPLLKLLDNKFKLISVGYKRSITINKENGLVMDTYKKLEKKDNYIIYISPEGTRKCTNKIKSGYWNIAKLLDIEIGYIGIDFYNKKISLEKPRKPLEDWDNEKELFIEMCNKYIPLYPERCYWMKDFYL